MMAKIVDITDKLSFDGNPKLVIKGKELEVNADAPTMLKVILRNDDPGVQEVLDAYDMMFQEKTRNEIDKMKLSFRDLMIVVQEAVSLITGDVGTGEQ